MRQGREREKFLPQKRIGTRCGQEARGTSQNQSRHLYHTQGRETTYPDMERRADRSGSRGGGEGYARKRRAGSFTDRLYAVEEYHPIQAGSIDGTDTVPHDRALKRAMMARTALLAGASLSANSVPWSPPGETVTAEEASLEPRVPRSLARSKAEPVPERNSLTDGAQTLPEGASRECVGEERAGGAAEDPAERVRRTLFVARLNWSCQEEDVRRAAEAFGEVEKVDLIRNIATGASRGYAFVEFRRASSCRRALLHGRLEGLEPAPGVPGVLVDFVRQGTMKGWVPRRLGGGLGGRKHSGQLRFGGPGQPFRRPMREVPVVELRKLGIPVPPHCFSSEPLPRSLST